MRFIQYFEYHNNKLVKAYGDRAIIIINGRYRISRCHEEAIENNNKSKLSFNAYQILEGETLANAKPVTNIFKL